MNNVLVFNNFEYQNVDKNKSYLPELEFELIIITSLGKSEGLSSLSSQMRMLAVSGLFCTSKRIYL